MNWNDFFVATATAAATLTGLIFVGVSISLTKILSIKALPNRALLSLILLMAILISSTVFLIPGQSDKMLGTEVLIIGFIVWAFTIQCDIKIYRQKEKQFKRLYLLNAAFNQVAVIPYLICGFTILSVGDIGIFWIVPAIIFSLIKSVIDAWVLLVEIHR